MTFVAFLIVASATLSFQTANAQNMTVTPGNAIRPECDPSGAGQAPGITCTIGSGKQEDNAWET